MSYKVEAVSQNATNRRNLRREIPSYRPCVDSNFLRRKGCATQFRVVIKVKSSDQGTRLIEGTFDQ